MVELRLDPAPVTYDLMREFNSDKCKSGALYETEPGHDIHTEWAGLGECY